MCFGYSKEPSHRDGSFDYPQHMFWMRNKENIFPIGTLVWRPEIRLSTLCMLGNFACFLPSADLFQNQLFSKHLSEIPSECQTVLIQVSLIWVHTVCIGYMQVVLSADFFFQINFFEKYFQAYHHNVRQFESRSGPNCFQRLSADDISR